MHSVPIESFSQGQVWGLHDEKKKSNPLGTFVEAKKEGKFEDYNVHEDPFMKKYTVLQK